MMIFCTQVFFSHTRPEINIKGTVSRDFLYSVLSPNNSSWSHQRCSGAIFIFFASWLSCKHFKMTPWYLGHRGVAPKTFSQENFQICMPGSLDSPVHRTPRILTHKAVKSLDSQVLRTPGSLDSMVLRTPGNRCIGHWGSHFNMLISQPRSKKNQN